MHPDGYADALRRERAQYQTSGLQDRVAQVTAELVRIGAEDPPPVLERAVRRPPETRRNR